MAHRFDRARRRDLGRPAANRVDSNGNDGGDPRRRDLGLDQRDSHVRRRHGHATAHVVHTRWAARAAAIHSPSPLHNPAISPDGRYVAADAIWIEHVDLARRSRARHSDSLRRRRATGLGAAAAPRSCSRRDALAARPTSCADRSAGASTDESLLLRTPEMKIGGNWTDDNRYIVYTGSDPRTKLDLWTLSVGGPEACSVSADVVQRDARAGVAGWAMAGVRVRRVGHLGGLRADISRAWRKADDFSWRWRRASVAARRTRSLDLPRAGRNAHGRRGVGHERNVRRWPRRSLCSRPGFRRTSSPSGITTLLLKTARGFSSMRLTTTNPSMSSSTGPHYYKRAEHWRDALPRRLLSFVHRTAVAITGIHTEYAEHSVRCFRLGGGSLNLRPFKNPRRDHPNEFRDLSECAK